MSFLDDLVRARTFLQEAGRVSTRALRRQFELDDEGLEAFVDMHRVAPREGSNGGGGVAGARG